MRVYILLSFLFLLSINSYAQNMPRYPNGQISESDPLFVLTGSQPVGMENAPKLTTLEIQRFNSNNKWIVYDMQPLDNHSKTKRLRAPLPSGKYRWRFDFTYGDSIIRSPDGGILDHISAHTTLELDFTEFTRLVNENDKSNTLTNEQLRNLTDLFKAKKNAREKLAILNQFSNEDKAQEALPLLQYILTTEPSAVLRQQALTVASFINSKDLIDPLLQQALDKKQPTSVRLQALYLAESVHSSMVSKFIKDSNETVRTAAEMIVHLRS